MSDINIQIENGYKVVVVGESGVGKSSILLRYINNTFSENIKNTIGVDNFEKQMSEKITLSIWDTAGQERFRGLSSSYYKNAKCVILVYDITNKKSFERLDYFRDEIKNYANKGILIILIGNKSDMISKRTVNREEVDDYCRKLGLFYIETSAFENEDGHIEKAFEYVAGKVLEVDDQSVERVEFSVGKGNREVLGGKTKDGCC